MDANDLEMVFLQTLFFRNRYRKKKELNILPEQNPDDCGWETELTRFCSADSLNFMFKRTRGISDVFDVASNFKLDHDDDLAGSWWKDPTADDSGISADEELSRDYAARMWRSACNTLQLPNAEDAYMRIEELSAPDTQWHSLRNCVSHQCGVWQNLISRGIGEVVQPAAFKMALVLRHTSAELVAALLGDLLKLHPQSDLTSYMLALLTDDEAGCGSCIPQEENSPAGPAPLRDLQLFGDCELAIMASSQEQYDAHAKLVRAEYAKLSQQHYIELRIRVLNQFAQIPKIFHTPEFSYLETQARENIAREITALREELLTNHGAK